MQFQRVAIKGRGEMRLHLGKVERMWRSQSVSSSPYSPPSGTLYRSFSQDPLCDET